MLGIEPDTPCSKLAPVDGTSNCSTGPTLPLCVVRGRCHAGTHHLTEGGGRGLPDERVCSQRKPSQPPKVPSSPPLVHRAWKKNLLACDGLCFNLMGGLLSRAMAACTRARRVQQNAPYTS